MPRGQRDVRRGCSACRHGARVGAGSTDAAVDQPGRCPGRVARVQAVVGDDNWELSGRPVPRPENAAHVTGKPGIGTWYWIGNSDRKPRPLAVHFCANSCSESGVWELVLGGRSVTLRVPSLFNIPPEGTAPGGVSMQQRRLRLGDI